MFNKSSVTYINLSGNNKAKNRYMNNKTISTIKTNIGSEIFIVLAITTGSIVSCFQHNISIRF